MEVTNGPGRKMKPELSLREQDMVESLWYKIKPSVSVFVMRKRMLTEVL